MTDEWTPDTRRVITTKSPDRQSEPSGENEYGKMWVSRAWDKDERRKYCQQVLNREPYKDEIR
jgi:hypothetical protein